MENRVFNKGFTLIELLVVIAIIALLAGIIMTNLMSSRSKARDAKRISDLGHIQLALELFYDRCKQYPGLLDASYQCPSDSTVTLGNYISQIPKDSNGDSYGYARGAGDPSFAVIIDYVLHAKLEGYNEAVKDGLNGRPPGISYWAGFDATVCSNSESSKEYCLGSK